MQATLVHNNPKNSQRNPHPEIARLFSQVGQINYSLEKSDFRCRMVPCHS